MADISFDHPLLDGYRQPELMAIGDSLFNGVRSLSISAPLAELSPPAQVADAFNWTLITPDYPRPVLFDIEAMFRSGVIDLKDLHAKILANAGQWMSAAPHGWSKRRFFDNVSNAGATIGSLFTDTYAKHYPTIDPLVNEVVRTGPLGIQAKGDLYYALNTAFLLNPAGIDELAFVTPVDLVGLRRPKRLLVNIGSNEGLFRACLSAKYGDFADSIERIPDLMHELGKALAPHASHVERIYVNSLVRPRCVGNLWTRADFSEPSPDCVGYFSNYVGRLGFLGGMSGAEMRLFDEHIKDINQRAFAAFRAAMPDPSRVHAVDCYALSSRHDRKHDCEAAADEIWVKLRKAKVRLSNLPLGALGGFKHGGLFGLDNLHLTGPGSALMAGEIAAVISATEGLPIPDPIDMQRVTDRDTLLQDIPKMLDLQFFMVGFVAAMLGIFSLVGGNLSARADV